ncbi:hypothetical protein GCM10010388_21830 [Streptomyces mauvecolor]
MASAVVPDCPPPSGAPLHAADTTSHQVNDLRGSARPEDTQHSAKAGTAMPTIGIILGSTRPNRVGDQVAHWVLDHASRRTDARFELLDLRAPCPTSTSRCRRPVGPASGLDGIGHLGFAWGPADGEPPVVTGMGIARSRQGLIIELHTIVTEIRPAP